MENTRSGGFRFGRVRLVARESLQDSCFAYQRCTDSDRREGLLPQPHPRLATPKQITMPPTASGRNNGRITLRDGCADVNGVADGHGNCDPGGHGRTRGALWWLQSTWGALELGRGVKEDFDARSPLYRSDWTDAWRTGSDLAVVVRAALYMVHLSLCSAYGSAFSVVSCSLSRSLLLPPPPPLLLLLPLPSCT